MTPIEALLELLGRVGARESSPVLVVDGELNQWPAEAVKAMKSQKLIMKARPSSSAICPGCERECVMQVHSPPAKTKVGRSFVVCDKRSDINRVIVPTERLNQWQCRAEMVCEFVAAELGLRRTGSQTTSLGLWEIGIAHGVKRTQMLCLKVDGELSLIAGDVSHPLADLILYSDGNFRIDHTLIGRLVDSSTTTDPRYTPSIARRESRKLDTKAMHETWQKEYRKLRKKHPEKSDVWISTKMSKSDIAQGRSAETIRKNMKK